MNTKAVKIMVVLTVFALSFGISTVGFSHNEIVGEMKEFNGNIALKLPGGYYLKQTSGDEYRLMLGPPWFLEEIGLTLRNGDKVSINGFDDGGNVIVVTSITKGTRTYEIFDADSVTEEGGYGCGGMWNDDHHRGWGRGHHGMWDRGSGGMWNRSNFYDSDKDRFGMMRGIFNSGKRWKI